MTELVASGGFCAPVGHWRIETPHGVLSGPPSLARMLPRFTAIMGGIDYRAPEVRWAERRERELRAEARMWDWPRPPA